MPVWVRRRKGIWFDHIHLSLSTVHTWNKVVDRLDQNDLKKSQNLRLWTFTLDGVVSY